VRSEKKSRRARAPWRREEPHDEATRAVICLGR